MLQTATRRITSPKQGALELKQTICALLGWDELQYAEFQYQMGLAYLGSYIIGDHWGQDMLQRTPLFWNWWKNQWMIRDKAFLQDQEEELSKLRVETCRSLYRHLHDAGQLACDIYPGRMIMDESYNQMIHSLIKEGVHA